MGTLPNLASMDGCAFPTWVMSSGVEQEKNQNFFKPPIYEIGSGELVNCWMVVWSRFKNTLYWTPIRWTACTLSFTLREKNIESTTEN